MKIKHQYEINQLVIFLFINLFPALTVVQAAEIIARPMADDGYYHKIFAIEGNIIRGDYKKFEDLVRVYGGIYNSVTIASKGGDIFEAMKIGRLIRKLRYSTWAPWQIGGRIISFELKDKTNNVCASACFFIYIAGVRRVGNIIGIHRPYLSVEDYKEMGIEDAIDAHKKLKEIITNYIIEMSVPLTYVDRLFSIAKEEIEWLEEEERNKNFDGFIPEMDEWVKAQCPSLTEIEITMVEQLRKKARVDKIFTDSDNKIASALLEKESDISDCQIKVHDKISCKVWVKHFRPKDSNFCKWID